MEKATVKRFSGVFLKLINLTAVICILCLIAGIARKKSNSPITLLSSTVTNVKSTRLGEGLSRSGTGGSVSNESEIKIEAEPQLPEKVQTIPENASNQQTDDSETNSESNIESNTESNTKQPEKWESIEMRVTAYCPCPKCCGEYSDGVTASGHEIQPGDTFVAADRRYPLRTEMLIPGYSNSRPVKVLDRGGAIKGNRLDVFFATHEEALKWGVKYLEVNVRRKNL